MTPFDLTTHDGQKAHYRAVRVRLGIAKPAMPAMPTRPLYDAPIGPKRLIPDDIALSLHDIAAAVCTITGISRLELESPRRYRASVRARMIYYYLARRHTNRSLPQIGRFMGDRDHTTVMHGIRKVVGDRSSFEPWISQVSKLLGRSA